MTRGTISCAATSATGALVSALLTKARPRAIVNFAAETHVDRSIHGPAAFIQTNVVGTFGLLDATRAWWAMLPAAERAAFRFVHVSTDEVYGSLSAADPAFSETTPYAPNSPVFGVEGRGGPPRCAPITTPMACRR
jgi:dTDP-glucose 4,6-dehydratase